MTQEDLLSPARDIADDANSKTTTRADLAEAVHHKTGLGRTESAKYVEMVLDEIFETIAAREDVKLSSFGAFLIRAKRERQGRNPKTGEGAKITARLVVSFKPSNVLRARINGVDEAESPTDAGKSKRAGAGKQGKAR
ncbi:integration host factor subunit alpha [Methylocystis parvus]|uniref:Integration host factor subunit alpha n=1 Tax=Methylocystis parvus TaxID=134 RepID=A0A6B8M9P0_9HYPH|nr:integration host factor subunit alpha [Methylocystis parvus]QGM99125.1 integration host factor subunit alpha [Methylocystis parvus]WBK00504.1 integration host factor subunit alpha [Methylocystis parvus OBBP]